MSSSRHLLVLYGSQTGTAQDVAERVARQAVKLHFETVLSSMDQYDIARLIEEALVVFVCSTTGQGDPPDNMQRFWRFLLQKSLPSDSLCKLRFGVIALGDSSYEKFNFVGKKLHRRLVQLGAFPLQPIGLADDQHDLGADGVVEPWLDALWPKALQLYPLPKGLDPIPRDAVSDPKFNIELAQQESVVQNSVAEESTQQFDQDRPFMAVLTTNERQTTEDHFQDTRLIEVDISGSGMTYRPGDVLMVQPSNSPQAVDTFFSLFPTLDRGSVYRVSPLRPELCPAPPESLLPRSGRTLEQIVSGYFDLTSRPRRYFFEVMANFADDDLEKEKLVEFTTAEGQEELFSYCHRPRRTILEVLADFRHTREKLSLQRLFDIIPAIQPRAFSIASSSRRTPNRVQILVAVVKYRSKLLEPRLGLCSNWLKNALHGQLIPVWIRKGTFRFPEQAPMLMVGPGTGIAPFKSYVTEAVPGAQFNLEVYFGCRYREKDFYYQREWSALQEESEGHLNVHCAFSRDKGHKVYVQHLIEERATSVSRLLVKGAYVFIAGNAKNMPDQVKDALERALETAGGMSKVEASTFMANMKKSKRIQLETWS